MCFFADLGGMARQKRQAPSSNIQRITKHQIPPHARGCWFGVWCLVLLWSLDVGAWCFPSHAFYRKQRRCMDVRLLAGGSRFPVAAKCIICSKKAIQAPGYFEPCWRITH